MCQAPCVPVWTGVSAACPVWTAGIRESTRADLAHARDQVALRVSAAGAKGTPHQVGFHLAEDWRLA